MIILNEAVEEERHSNAAQIATQRRYSSTVSCSSSGSMSGSFTLIVFDMKSGKITCSLVSKDQGSSSDGISTNLSSDAVKSLNEEMSKLVSKSIVSAGCFNVWKGLFK